MNDVIEHATKSRADRYFAVWGLVLPITSVVIIPFVQGTTIAYIMALALLFPVVNVIILRPAESRVYYVELSVLVAGFIILLGLAQLGVSFADVRYLKNINLVDPTDESILLRKTMFTQSLYLLAGAATFVFVKSFYKPSWDRFLMYGAVFLALYGMYEVGFFALFKHSGDFLSNRKFGGGSWFGSQMQTMALGPILLQRLKSLTGEPSMYAFTILPFWIYSVHTGRRWQQWILLASLLLSTSSTAAAGIAIYIAIRFLRHGVFDRFVLAALIAIIAVAMLGVAGNEVVLRAYNNIIVAKIFHSDYSGMLRFKGFVDSMEFYAQEPVVVQIFGLGFGYIREANMLSTILVNLGIVGLVSLLAIFLYPVIRVGGDERARGLRAALIVILVTLLVAVPGFEHLSVWLFLGMSYNKISSRVKKESTREHNLGDIGPQPGFSMSR